MGWPASYTSLAPWHSSSTSQTRSCQPFEVATTATMPTTTERLSLLCRARVTFFRFAVIFIITRAITIAGSKPAEATTRSHLTIATYYEDVHFAKFTPSPAPHRFHPRHQPLCIKVKFHRVKK